MRDLATFPSVFVCPQAVDFRKGRKSLAVFVQETLAQNPFSDSLFLFINSKHNSIKALYWDSTGFALWEKGLEEARFPWPKAPWPSKIEVTPEQLHWLLRGLDIWKMKTHKNLEYSVVL